MIAKSMEVEKVLHVGLRETEYMGLWGCSMIVWQH